MTISSGTQVILLSVLIGFIACCSIYLIIFYLKIYYKVISKTKRCNNEVEANSNEIQDGTGISVIITANDQEYELRRNLEKILKQKYSKFEVIVVLDSEADDASEDLLAAYSEKYPNLYQTFIPKESKYLNRHKLMLSIGIKASHYDWLLFTDANCQPGTDLWIQSMANKMTSDKRVVIGPMALQPHSKDYPISLWKNIQNTLLNQMLNTLGMALNGMPYRASGKNMAYRKSLFNEKKGFSKQLTFEGGEDSLLVNNIANKINTAVVLNKQACIYTEASCTKKYWRKKCEIEKKIAAKLTGPAANLILFKKISFFLMSLCTILSIVLSSIGQNWIRLGIVLFLWLVPVILLLIIKSLAHKMYYL